jgi:porphobilinogen deaminase
VAAPPGAEPVVRLSSLIAALDGSAVIRGQATGTAAGADALGRRLAHRLLRDGGAAILGGTSPAHPALSGGMAAELVRRGS